MGPILIYLFPAIIDLVLFVVFFMTTVRAAQQGASASGVANLLTVWAIVYMLSSLVAGRAVTRKNAANLLITSCLATALVAIAFVGCQSLKTMYVLMAAQGVAMALFFTPFQVFMRVVGESKRRPITVSVGLYTFSWSIGAALGPLVSGLVWQSWGWRVCHTHNALIALGVAVGIYRLKHHAQPAPLPNDHLEAAPLDFNGLDRYRRMPDLAWMGWLFSGIGCIAISLIRGVFPSSGAAFDLPKYEQGMILFILSAVQAVVGLALARGRWWMYRPLSILVFGLFGLAGLILFSLAQATITFSIAAACFGVWSGSFFFYLVFHSLVHPERSSRYVSINEAMVGLTSIVGPLLGGLIGDYFTLDFAYRVMAVVVLPALFLHAGLHLRIRGKTRETLG
ncbi:MAG: MFS transporter [Phycisphaerales bacterium]|nr:MFS transporter [Phycisphaerales bacterium]